jgi:glucose/arabinose dehydrogenase
VREACVAFAGLVRVSLIVTVLVHLVACSSGEATPTDSGATATGAAATETASGPSLPRFALTRVVNELDSPVHLASTPSEPDRLYIVEQPGRIRVIEGGSILPAPFLDITSQVRSGGEQGLFSVAFHPEYESNGLFYVDYTDQNGDTRVVEYGAQGSGAPARRRELLFVDQPYANHNGGQLAFGPDGRLYVGMGDGGSAGDPQDRAQNLGEKLGKLLSLDVDAQEKNWTFEGYGLRNPWRFSFDRETGDLWIADVGERSWEEIDFTPHDSAGLENYGWNVYEGRHVFYPKDVNPRGHLVEPLAEYSHDEGCSVTGGFVYRGEAIPAARGLYFYGDYCSGHVWSLARANGKAEIRRLGVEVTGLSSFGEDASGELYLVSNRGGVYKLDAR